MHKLNSKWLLTAALSAALLAGCGGGSDSSGSLGGGGFAVSDIGQNIGQNINTVFEYVSRLIADNGENTDPVDINGFTLATDETSSPTPLP